MRLNEEFMGRVVMSPDTDVTAGEVSSWTFTFTAGKYGIDEGGTFRIAWRSVSDWEAPQFDNPKGFAYTTAVTDGEADIFLSYASYIRPFGNSILFQVRNGFLKEGDQVTIVLGDRSKGGPGMRAQSFCEREHEFRFLIDPCGTGRYEELPGRPVVRIVAGRAHEIQAIIPGTVRTGEPFDCVVRSLDEFGNPTPLLESRVRLSIPEFKGSKLPQEVSLTGECGGSIRVSGLEVYEEGCFHVEISTEDGVYTAVSNASCAAREPEYRLYWGDMHAQTSYTVGTGSLDDYYSFARHKAALDFTGWQGNDFEVDDIKWDSVREKTKEYNEENKFLVFLGYEWSGITPLGGDYNVFFKGDNEHFYPSSNWTAMNNVDPERNASPVSELWDIFKGRDDVMLIPHIGGRYGNLDFFNPEFSSVIEIHSHHGTFEWFAMEAMKRRMKVGFIATSDDHTCRPGLSYPLSGNGKSASSAFDVASGFTGVFAADLTKESVWEAIRARRCYASSFDRVYMDVSVNGHRMGEEFDTTKALKLRLNASGTYPVDNVKIYDWDRLVADLDMQEKDEKKIRVRWSGVMRRGRNKSASWNGDIYVRNGRITGAEEYAFDRNDQGIKQCSDKFVKWVSSTSGDYDGLYLSIDGDESTTLDFCTERGSFSVSLKDIYEGKKSFSMGGENLLVEFERANREIASREEETDKRSVSLEFELEEVSGEHAYWVKVTQDNGNAAWSSPVFVNRG